MTLCTKMYHVFTIPDSIYSITYFGHEDGRETQPKHAEVHEIKNNKFIVQLCGQRYIPCITTYNAQCYFSEKGSRTHSD